VRATPLRTARPPREPAAVGAGAPAAAPVARHDDVAVAVPRTLHKRPPSSYLKPAPAMSLPVPSEPQRPRWPWVVVCIFVLLGAVFATGVGIIDGSATEPRTAEQTPLPSRAEHTITPVQFEFVPTGTTRAKVLAGLDKRPAPYTEYRKVFPGAKVDPRCLYWYGRSTRGAYRICFDDANRVVSKATVTNRRVARAERAS
jgi:hypothetical protein